MQGTNEDGQSYIADAINSGASAVITNKSYTEDAKSLFIRLE